MPLKVLTVIGARPQFIKAGPVADAMAKAGVEEVLVHTGQHFDANMSDVFFTQLNIPRPKYNLGIGGSSHGDMTGRQLIELEKLLIDEQPDWVLVYGDTNSTLAGALAAAKLHIPIAHVEAGLRSFNRRMPEEINRILTDQLSTVLFTPTSTATENLRREGVAEERIVQVGDVMLDATTQYKTRANEPEWFAATGLQKGNFVLCTIHRAENTDSPERLQAIFEGLAASNRPIVAPIHPRTQKCLDRLGIEIGDNIRCVPPVGYLEMNWLEANCDLVVTDSGGVQKEAFFHGKYCLTIRDETEWVELIQIGANSLIPADSAAICTALKTPYPFPSEVHPYGNGTTATQIVEFLQRELRPFQ
ncbi:non-hydrolyzing UDP-N-acetylglucosamine 2-epimerase [Aureliella helgolandensis]|uniref:UDP-2,3-diacetamido-2,3-dideoxy-D-glucuronate 2-epimerase n=1 Tax=Aureliella helgolandensis TaxID=2527968 RepID=A0A518GC62_9BACT|nr:UDP-N-acetylglucosamine 2-epimerase (non-hydrolyzing) [Aureliella helgolandensis]QDV26130.1 UDP-2,3-diacetamido-2,3-dideoxy-D-glucuronate 2-epimerase [Aureliella helgolandensis]